MSVNLSAKGKKEEGRAATAPQRGVSASPASVAVRVLLHHRAGMAGLVITLLLVIVALLAPSLVPHGAMEMHAQDRLAEPSRLYLFGTDEFGRDIFSRVLMGSRISLSVGLISIGIASVVGVTVGSIAGYACGWFETVTMRIADTLLAFPAMLLAIVIIAVLGPGAINALLAIAIVNLPAFARLARANVLAEKCKDYVEASRALGATHTRILFINILPNTLSTVLVQVTVSVGSAVLLEAALSFLGLGPPPTEPSWGSMLSIGRGFLGQAWWYGVFPGIALMLLVMGLYLLGDGLSDALDPRQQQKTH